MLRRTSAAVIGGALLTTTMLIPGVSHAPVKEAAALGLPPAPAAPPAAPPKEASAVDEKSASATVLSPAERDRLTRELASWKTRDAGKLVDVIADVAEREAINVSPTLLLSIAWIETRGKILAVSPAGAAGLAQATPAAFLSEGLDGKVFVTTDYLAGTRAYIMKKPLGDALGIARPLLTRNSPAARARASELLDRAIDLRREGMDELEALAPVATATFHKRIAEGEAYNLAKLQELRRLIDRGAPPREMKAYHARIQRDYKYLMNVQRNGWTAYARQLEARRDALLRQRYGTTAARVMLTRPYEAGEYLGETLDARFSPTAMTTFLAAHLETKGRQAIQLGIPHDQIEQWTAALYNGGALNVKRMRAGLLRSLRETEKYMATVPARRAQLERAIEG